MLELLVVMVIIGLLAGFVAPRYFETVGMRLLAGREFEFNDDVRSAHVVIINERMLREAFGVSGAEARRLLAGGGVKVNGDALAGDELDVGADRLRGAILQLGKRRFVRLVDGSAG